MQNKIFKTLAVLTTTVFIFSATASVLAIKGKSGESQQQSNQTQTGSSGNGGSSNNNQNAGPDTSNQGGNQSVQNTVDSVAAQIEEIAQQVNNFVSQNNPQEQSNSSGQGYALGKLDMEIGEDEPAEGEDFLLIDPGEEREKPGEYELKNRIYEAVAVLPLEPIKLKINDEVLFAKDIKIKTSYRIRGLENQLRGGIDIALTTGESIAMQFDGAVLEKTSAGIKADVDIEITSATGRFLSLTAFAGNHIIDIQESGNVVGSPVEILITDISHKDISSTAQTQTQTQTQPLPQPLPLPLVDSSGPGYPTGPLNILLPATELLLNRAGEVKEQPGQLEIKNRLYEETGEFPVTINGEILLANEVKVGINLKTKTGSSEMQGLIDIDIDDPATGGHLTIEYKGSAIVSEDQIISGGNFKTTKTTGRFAGLVAEGTYTLIVDPSGNTQVLKADITLSTISNL